MLDWHSCHMRYPLKIKLVELLLCEGHFESPATCRLRCRFLTLDKKVYIFEKFHLSAS